MTLIPPTPSEETPVEQLSYEQLTYEQAFAELEQIVRALEAGEHTLDDSVHLYERGQMLARRCAELLEQAELKVRQLAGDDMEDFSG